MNRIERLMNKLIPDIDRASSRREQTTRETVAKSAQHRREAEDAVFDAYRAAGLAISTARSHRKWED